MILADLAGIELAAKQRNKQGKIDQANIDYNANLAASQAPLPRLLDQRGKLNQDTVSSISPPPPFQKYYSDAQARMPKGVPVNMAKLQEDYGAMVQNFDMQAGNALAQAKQFVSDRRLVKNMQNSNPNLLGYYQSTNQLPSKVKDSSPGMQMLGSLGTQAALYGGIRGIQLASTMPTPTPEQLVALRDKGFKWQDGKIQKLKLKEIVDPVSVRSGSGTTDINKRIAKRFGKKVIAERSNSSLGRLGGTALKKGTSTAAGRAATNAALKAVAGTGGLLSRMFAGGRMGAMAGGPWGAIIGAALLPAAAGIATKAFKD